MTEDRLVQILIKATVVEEGNRIRNVASTCRPTNTTAEEGGQVHCCPKELTSSLNLHRLRHVP